MKNKAGGMLFLLLMQEGGEKGKCGGEEVQPWASLCLCLSRGRVMGPTLGWFSEGSPGSSLSRTQNGGDPEVGGLGQRQHEEGSAVQVWWVWRRLWQVWQGGGARFASGNWSRCPDTDWHVQTRHNHGARHVGLTLRR